MLINSSNSSLWRLQRMLYPVIIFCGLLLIYYPTNNKDIASSYFPGI
ncbi:hypothetical protein ASZ90_018039 [hydrocarbon metagenome]|uniref:Uncharacterized protein n=1 Tax=hydrocarbon metagenome TaxID=938273 RepID=A0A0W8E7G7_9ZZZZ